MKSAFRIVNAQHGNRYSFHRIVTHISNVYSAISTRHNAPQAGAGPLGRIGTCSFLKKLSITAILVGEYSQSSICRASCLH